MFKDLILKDVENAIAKSKFQGLNIEEIALRIETPKNPDFGDYAVNVSSLARFAKMAPPLIANKVVEHLKFEGETTVVGGFINFKLTKEQLSSIIEKIAQQKDNYGRNNYGQNEKVNIEYVSANPTGPFHIGHGRWAAMGSTLAALMKFSSYDVFQEFYINDAGSQIKNLGRSLWIRVLQESGKEVEIPSEGEEAKGYYPGEYLIPVAKDYLKENKEQANEFIAQTKDFYNPGENIIDNMSEFAKNKMGKLQKDLLENFGVNFNNFFSETSLYDNGEINNSLKQLETKLYEKDGATWLRTTDFGDDQDRVLIKKDGSYTYLTPDIAYHNDKFKRANRLINIWGADHHGYICRMKAAMQFIGNDPEKLEVLLGQLVNLIIDGQPMRMGKRKKMYTLADLIDEVGVDATRFWMIMRSIETTLDFDIDLAKSKSDENPVFYVQYAHARACSILRNATAERFDTETKEKLTPFFSEQELNEIKNNANALVALAIDDEKSYASTKALILKLEGFQELILQATKQRAPYMLCRYAQELATEFHQFYTFSRVLNVETNLMHSRLALVFAFKQVMATTLNLLGVSAPEAM